MSKGATTKQTTSAADIYVRRLAYGLEALGPAEQAEVLEEIRGHLAEATAEAGGDEAGALAGFGSPEMLAGRILEERGLFSGPRAVPEAPSWRRHTARLIDALAWVAGFLFFGLIPLTVVFWQHTTLAGLDPLWVVGFWLFFSGVAASAGWWSVYHRRSAQRTSAGMRTLGLQRVQMGEEIRLVRAGDLPGRVRAVRPRLLAISSTVVTIAILGFFFLVVGFMAANAVDDGNRAMINNALSNSAGALMTVEDIYAEIEAGGPAAGFSSQSLLGPEASAVIGDLVGRRDAGHLAQHRAYLANPYDVERWAGGIDDVSAHIAVPVTVDEYRLGGDRPQASYEYVVSWILTDTADGREGRWQITSVRPVEAFPDMGAR